MANHSPLIKISPASHNGTIQPIVGDDGEGLMNKTARSNRREDVLSFAREHAWQPRGGSNVHTFIPVLLERLEAENAQLRSSVVELVLQINALRDALGHPQSETQPKSET
jgi:hypothetical protein